MTDKYDTWNENELRERCRARDKRIAQLEARIAELVELLQLNDLPTERTTCQCCGESYMPKHYTSVRCWACCQTCHTDGPYSRTWIHGPQCPLNRKKT
jgi:hypothetical protein